MGSRSEYQKRYYQEKIKPKRQAQKLQVVDPEDVQQLNEENLKTDFAPRVEISTPQTNDETPWTKIGYATICAAVCLLMTAFLVTTAQKVYSRDVGDFWAWVLAIGFEVVILLLASYRAPGQLVLKTIKSCIDSLPTLLKTLFTKSAMVALAVYTFSVLTVDIDYNATMRPFKPPSTAQLEADLALEQKALQVHIDQRATGNIAKTQKTIKEIQAKITATMASVTSEASLAAEAKRDRIKRAYRAIALIINVILGHIVASIIREIAISSG